MTIDFFKGSTAFFDNNQFQLFIQFLVRMLILQYIDCKIEKFFKFSARQTIEKHPMKHRKLCKSKKKKKKLKNANRNFLHMKQFFVSK